MTMSSARLMALFGIASLTFSADRPWVPTTTEQSIRRVATLRAARAAHTATTLPSGGILLAGGMTEGGGSLASVERFDPRDNSIHEVGSLGTPRAGHTATLLPDGRVLVAGGYNGEYLKSLELFDPATGRSELVGSMSVARESHTATLLQDGRILIVGGHSGRRQNMVVYSSAE